MNVAANVHERIIYKPDGFVSDLSGDSRLAWRKGDCLPQYLSEDEVYDFEAVYQTSLLSTAGLYDDMRLGTYTPRWLSHTEGRLQLTSISPGWRATRDTDGTFWLKSELDKNMTMRTLLEADNTTTFPEIYRLHVDSTRGISYLRSGSEVSIAVGNTSSTIVAMSDVLCYGACEGKTDAPFSLIRSDSDTVGALMDTARPDGAAMVVSSFFANGTDTHVLREATMCRSDSFQMLSLMTGRCMTLDSDTVRYVTCGDMTSRTNGCWTMRLKHTHTMDTRTRTISFEDSGLRPQDSVASPLRQEDMYFLQPNTSTDLLFTLIVPADSLDPVAGVSVETVQLFDLQGRRVVATVCVGQWPSGETRVCQGACTTRGGESQCASIDLPGYGTCTESCFPRLLTRAGLTTALHQYVFGMEFELRALTVGYQLRLYEWDTLIESTSTVCIASATDKGDRAGLQMTSCNSLDQDFFVPRDASLGDSETLSDQRAFALESSTRGGCIGFDPQATGRLRLVSCNASSQLVYVRSVLRLDAALLISPRAVQIGEQPLIAYASPTASIRAFLHRRVLTGTVRVDVEIGGEIVTVVDSKGGLTNAATGWVYVCRVTRSANGNLYSLLRNGTLLDNQWRPATGSTSRRNEVGVRQRIVDTSFNGQVIQPSLRISRLEGGAPPPLDDAERRFASGIIWRMFRRGGTTKMTNGTYMQCAQACRDRGTECASARWAQFSRECELLLKCDRTTQPAAAGYPNSLNQRAMNWFLYERGDTGALIGGGGANASVNEPATPEHVSVVAMPQASYTGILDSGYTELIKNTAGTRRLLVSSEEWRSQWFKYASTVHYNGISMETSQTTPGTVNTSDTLSVFASVAGFPTLLRRSRDERVRFECTGARIFVLSGVFRPADASYGYRRLLETASEAGAGGAQMTLSPEGDLMDRVSKLHVDVTRGSGCISVVIVQCLVTGMTVSVDGRVVHRSQDCPFNLDATDTTVHSWAGRRDAMCFSADMELQPSQHADLVGFLQYQATGAGDQICWQGNELDNGAVAARFYALQLSRAHATVPIDSYSWGAVSMSSGSTRRVLMTCKDPLLCPGSDLYEYYHLDVPGYASQLLRATPTGVQYATFTRANTKIWYNSLTWTPWTLSSLVVCPAPCSTDTNVVSSRTLQEQRDACNFNGVYHDDMLSCARVTRLPFDASVVGPNIACATAVECNCDSRYMVDGTSEEVVNTCTDRCEQIEEPFSHPQQRAGDVFKRNTGRAETEMLQAAQAAWGAKIVFKVNRIRDPVYAGCPGYYTTGCTGNVRCDFRLDVYENCTQKCPPAARFGLDAALLSNVLSPTTRAPCRQGAECGHSVTACRFRRKVTNFPDLVKHYGNESAARAVVLQTHLEDVWNMGKIRHTQSFQTNQCGRPVYENASIRSLASMVGNTMVEFDMHQHEVYGEWDFKWASPDVLRKYNISRVACAQPCRADVCSGGTVGPRPVGSIPSAIHASPWGSSILSGVMLYITAWACALGVLVTLLVVQCKK